MSGRPYRLWAGKALFIIDREGCHGFSTGRLFSFLHTDAARLAFRLVGRLGLVDSRSRPKENGGSEFSPVFPERSPGPDLRRMMHGLILGYIELFHELRKPTVKVEIRNKEILAEHLKTGRGALLIGGHFGSWDLLGPVMNRDTKFRGAAIVKVPKVEGHQMVEVVG